MKKQYYLASEIAVKWLDSKLTDDGYYGLGINDLACYYKSPYLLYISGKIEHANRIINYIQTRFLRKNGDFTTQENLKSENSAFVEYWTYMNAWIAIAAQKMGRFDVAYPAYHYLNSFSHPELGGFTTNKPYQKCGNVVDILTTSHLGLTTLYFGDLERSKSAGNLLQKFINIQPNLQSGFYLRINDDGKLLREFPEEASIFFFVSATQPNQAYFMIGYPIAFLGKLYLATGDNTYLKTAQKYPEFALNCHESIYSFHFSHKVAWGAAIIANITQELKYADFSTSITDYLLEIQDKEGVWLKEQPPHTSFDQTAEIAIWLKEISAELSKV